MNTLDQQIVLISTLDSKGEETAFLKELVKKAGRLVCVIDVGTAGTPAFAADITREEVAKKATTMAVSDGPVDALAAMAAGAAVIVREMFNAGAVSAVAGIGGGKGSGVFHSITKDLPYGFPKVLVTSARPALLAEIATTTDTILLPTLVDLFGINEFTRLALGNAGKILAALSWTMPEITSTKRVAVTAFGVTTPAVQSAKSKLESAGITVIVFPANGAGGRTMEALIAKFVFDGVIDLTTTEMADLLLGGTASAGKDRLTAAGACGIPQIIAPGATDMVNFGPPDTLPEKYSGRTKYQHTPMTTLVLSLIHISEPTRPY